MLAFKKMYCYITVCILAFVLVGCASSTTDVDNSASRNVEYNFELPSDDSDEYEERIARIAKGLSHTKYYDVPELLYADENKVVFFDSLGVCIYSFEYKRLIDYISLQDKGFVPRTEGDYATEAFCAEKGKIICIKEISSDEAYVYDCNTKKGLFESDARRYEYEKDVVHETDVTKDDSYGHVYQLDNGDELYWKYIGDAGDNECLRLCVKHNGETTEHTVFR